MRSFRGLLPALRIPLGVGRGRQKGSHVTQCAEGDWTDDLLSMVEWSRVAKVPALLTADAAVLSKVLVHPDFTEPPA